MPSSSTDEYVTEGSHYFEPFPAIPVPGATFSWYTQNGTALDGQDFTSSSGSVDVSSSGYTVDIPILDDGEAEPEETFLYVTTLTYFDGVNNVELTVNDTIHIIANGSTLGESDYSDVLPTNEPPPESSWIDTVAGDIKQTISPRISFDNSTSDWSIPGVDTAKQGVEWLADHAKELIVAKVTGAVVEKAEDLFTEIGEKIGLPDLYDQIKKSKELYDSHVNFMTNDFNAIDDVLKGKISLDEFLERTDQFRNDFVNEVSGIDEKIKGVVHETATGVVDFVYPGESQPFIKPSQGHKGAAAAAASSSDTSFNLVLSTGPFQVGSNGRDGLSGSDGFSNISGQDGDDIVFGNGGDDSLFGGRGNDVLVGGPGADTFIFDTKLNRHSNVDRIHDFSEGEDMISIGALKGATFTDLGYLRNNAFYSGKHATGAHDGNDRIIYNKTTGNVYFDSDGRGGHKAIKFAVLDHSPDHLSAKDFVAFYLYEQA